MRNFNQNVWALYASDKWRIRPRLTLTLGLRWELPGVVNERDALELSPVIQGSAVNTLLSDATLAVFDKTGTLTVGKPSVKKVLTLPGFMDRDVLRSAAAVDIATTKPRSVLTRRLLAGIARDEGGDVAKAVTGDPA